MKIKEIAFTGYPVTDIARARRFYEQVLQLKPTLTFGGDGQEWVEYDIGAGTIAITNLSPDQWKPSRDGPAIAFEVEDFDAAVAAVRAAGATFYVEPMQSPACRLAVIADPDGNSLALHRRNKASA